jgi:hypothetical protein
MGHYSSRALGKGHRFESRWVRHKIKGSVPDTWVTVYTEDIGNAFGPKGFARGSSLQVSSSKYPRS